MPLDRRALLRLAAVSAALPALAACGDDDPGAKSTGDRDAALQDVGQGAAATLQIGDAESEVLVGAKRYAFGLRNDAGPVSNASVVVYVGRDPAQPAEQVVQARSLVEAVGDRGLYVAPVTLSAAGDYYVAVVSETQGVREKGGTRVTVKATSPSPRPGDQSPAFPTPTTAAPMGAEPLCSRKPVCSLHDLSLDTAVRNGKPTVVVFAAPAFCATELCGPDVDIVNTIAQGLRDQANFIHVEAYRKQGKELAPALQSFKFTTEPWTYFIDAKGVVTDRISGAFGAEEIRERLKALGVE